jgi:hypothetical protein
MPIRIDRVIHVTAVWDVCSDQILGQRGISIGVPVQEITTRSALNNADLAS